MFVAVVPYCMIHFQKPLPEALGAIVAGVVLGALSLRTGSVLGGAAVHVAVAHDGRAGPRAEGALTPVSFYLLGVNLPWLDYGLDFGANA